MKIRLIFVAALFLFVVYEILRHSYMIVSTLSVIAGVGILALLLAVYVLSGRRT
jgi:hypothetical protein